MDTQTLQFIAGSISSIMFVVGTVPMLLKAVKTRDLTSYSLSNISISTIGNGIYWLYVAGLPVGPVWLLHGFNTLSTLLMLFWYLKYVCNWARPCKYVAHGEPMG